MRVLSISTLFPSPARPGFGKFVANQMRGVAESGDVDLTVINTNGLPPLPARLLALREPYASLAACPARSDLAGIAVYHPPFTTIPVIGGDGNPARIARAILPLARRLHAERPFDLIDAQFFFPDGPAAMRIAAALGLPFTVKARGSDIHYWRERPRALRQMRQAAQAAAGMLAVSAALKGDMAALGFPAERIRVHYTGLDHAKFQPLDRIEARSRLADLLGLWLPGGVPLLVCPGALIALKGQALAIRAVAHIPRAHLALAGTGADEAALRALTAEAGLENRVHFLGQVSHDALPVLMAAADAVVLPSEREGLANVWIEALACGAPLVIPDIGGAREVVTDAEAGRLAAREPGAIALACRELIDRPPARAAVAAHAARFSWANNAAELVEFWREVARR
jgi:glycosyltransferase involved in cell wall biosynthesis